jgi:nitrogen regulatory protein PII
MKQVIAFVQPFMVQKVVDALHAIPGLAGATFADVKGFGRGRSGKRDQETLLGTTHRARVDVMVRDSLVDEVVGAIQGAAHTGNRGDGKIYVAGIDRAIRISSGEEGENAV